MAEKSTQISMIIILVDLDCHKCYNKMRKILCQLQDRERIQTISFDDKSKTITVVGPFDPQRLACKIRCKGGKVVKDVHIVDAPPQMMAAGPPPAPSPPRAKSGKHKNKEKPSTTTEPPPPAPPPAPPTPPPEMLPASPVRLAPPGREMTAGMQPFVDEMPPKARPAELELRPMSPPPQPPTDMPNPVPVTLPPPKERPLPTVPCRPVERHVEYVIPTVEIPSWPAPPVGPCGCPCCAPCYQGCYEACRCFCCGQVSYGSARPLLPAAGACGYGYRGCRTFSDEDPSAACSVM
ncbi:hypothetical protein BS78_05G211700 [Paspalum vaginatum]|nr:hypothetical protein BS78_05G211700 [Paspalum vaginatum]